MYEWKTKDLNDHFEMRKGERIVDLEKYVGLLKKNNIPFTKAEKYFFNGKDFRHIINLLKNKRL